VKGDLNCRGVQCSTPRHHWLEDADSLTGKSCKHCLAMGAVCNPCEGRGVAEGSFCTFCLGHGTVEVVRTELGRLAHIRHLLGRGEV
jgi:DnaJ-class molecular chaperone